MFDNHFTGNNNQYIFVQVIVNPPTEKQVEVKKKSIPIWDRVKAIFSGGSSLIDFIKKFYWIALFFLSG